MARLYVTLVVFHACLLAGCMGQLAAGAGVQVPVGVVAGGVVEGGEVPEGPVGLPYAPGEDRHWMQADDYFVSEHPWGEDWVWAALAKMKRPPGPDSKDQALFFQVQDSRDVWTRHYVRTRPAEPGDLVLGARAICFNDNSSHDVYRAPSSKHQARTGSWFMGKITDVSDVYKHQIRVSVYDCAIEAVRVIVR